MSWNPVYKQLSQWQRVKTTPRNKTVSGKLCHNTVIFVSVSQEQSSHNIFDDVYK